MLSHVYIRNVLAVSLYKLEVVIIHPDPPLEITFVLLHLLGSDVENVGVELIFLLLADIQNAVFRKFVTGKYERQAVLNVVGIFAPLLDAGQGELSRKDNIFD